MIVRRFDEKDFAQIVAWGAEWGDVYELDQLPKVGFIVDGCGAYFVYQTDSKVCWLENLITKRDLDAGTKAIAIDLLIEAAIKEARALGFKLAYAATDNFSAAKRAREHGAFAQSNFVFLTKDLTK